MSSNLTHMGRYYSGDIKGKFWFGVQDSNDAEFFGGQRREPNFVEYYFCKEDDWKTLCEGLERCKSELGPYKAKLDSFFDEHAGWNESMLGESLKMSRGQVLALLKWYARLILGEKIRHCLERQDECIFQAELG